jgi:hypothetical protein
MQGAKRWLDRWVTPGAQRMLAGMAVVSLLALACWLPLYLTFGRYPDLPSRQELETLVRTVPPGSTEAQVLAFLRANGFPDSDIRIVTNASPDGGNRIVAQSGPRRAYALNPRYLLPTFNFDERGRLVEAGVGGDNRSLAERDASFPPGGVVQYITPPPAR